jgi:hypothetical protein
LSSGVVDPNEVVTAFKATFPKAIEVLKLAIKKLGEKDWRETIETIQRQTNDAVMKH